MAIRVLHLIGSLRLGGAQVVVKHLVENADETVEHFVYPLRCKNIDIPIDGHVIKLPYPNYDPRKFFAILSLCKKYNIDMIHAHLHKPIIGALMARFFQKTPVIVHEHGPITRSGIQYSAYRFLLRLLKKRAQRFIAVSNTVASQLTERAKIDPARIEVVYNAVDLKTFVPKPELRQSVREELGIKPDDIVIGFAGRLSYVKGPDILLEAFGLLHRKNPHYMLVFLGRGYMKDQLVLQAENLGIAGRVKFLGHRDNVAEIMNIFDIKCMPSRQEPFGIAALEIMSMQIPLVCSGVDGLAEFVTNDKNALVPRNNTPPEISTCIERLTHDEKLRQSLIENASVSVQRFDIPNLVAQINHIYHITMETEIE